MKTLTLLEALGSLPDPRDRRGRRHSLTAILSLAVVATLAGMKSLDAIAQFGRDHGKALAPLLGFRRFKTPTKSTFSIVFRMIDVAVFEAILRRWLAARHVEVTALAIDGKTLRGSASGEVPGMHLLTAFAPQAAAVLGQLRVASTTNEHKAALQLLGVLPLNGVVVTGDAMFTHRDLCETVRARHGDYLLPVKDNQATLQMDIRQALTDDPSFSPLPTTAQTGHGTNRHELGQRTRAHRTASAHEHDRLKRLFGLARCGTGVLATAGTH